MIARGPVGQRLRRIVGLHIAVEVNRPHNQYMCLVKDRYGIAWIAAPTFRLPPQLKVLAISDRTGGQCIPYTMETVRDRTYPLISQIYMFANRGNGGAVKPIVREFLRYVVSRQGQEQVERDGKYLPLTAKVAREQWRKVQ